MEKTASTEAPLDGEQANLTAEFTSLQKQQWQALDRAIYVGMTVHEAQEYERRARRIIELQRALGVKLTIPPKSNKEG